MSERTRAYIYRIVLAVAALLVAYGFITAEEAGHWAVLAAAVLAIGGDALAVTYTSTKEE